METFVEENFTYKQLTSAGKVTNLLVASLSLKMATHKRNEAKSALEARVKIQNIVSYLARSFGSRFTLRCGSATLSENDGTIN